MSYIYTLLYSLNMHYRAHTQTLVSISQRNCPTKVPYKGIHLVLEHFSYFLQENTKVLEKRLWTYFLIYLVLLACSRVIVVPCAQCTYFS